MEHRTQRQLYILVLTVFLDLLGMSLIIPVAAPLFLGSNLTLFGSAVPLQSRTLMLGLLLGTGPVVQFLMAPLLGAYSDRVGRKPVLLISVLVNALSYVLFGLGIVYHNLALLFVSRALSGVGSANMSAANSAIADMSTRETKVRNYGLLGMAVGLGFIFGPFLGGKLSDTTVNASFTLATPLWVASVLAVVNAVTILLFFRESIRNRLQTPMHVLTGFRNIVKAFTLPNLRAMYLVSFLFGFGFNFFVQFFSVFLIARFAFTSSSIGALFAYVGIWMALSQGVFARTLSKYASPRTVIRWSVLAAAVVLLVLAGAHTVTTVYWLVPLAAIAYGLNPPNMTTLVSDLAERDSQGEALGISQSMSALSMGLPPVLSGWFVGTHVALPLIGGAAFMLAAWALFVHSRISNDPVPIFHEIA